MSSFRFLLLGVIFVAVSLIVSAPIDESDECGVSDFPGSHAGERIINGTKVPQGKYPWVAFLSTGPDACTASIVSRKYILTAGHCVCEQIWPPPKSPEPCKPLELSKLIVVVGSIDYATGKQHKLEEPVDYSKDVRRVCLSSKRQEGDPEKNVVITGWGYTDGHFPISDVLREGTGRVADDKLCKQHYIGYGTDNICITPHNHTMTFKGDSGGPAMVNENGRWIEVGITSYGTGDVDFDIPKVNVRVSHFCDWIAEETNNDVQCDSF